MINHIKKLTINDIILLTVILIFFFIFRFKLINSDSLLAWPITESIARGFLYNNEDLIIKAGVEGNFLLYKILAYFPLFSNNYPLRDFIIYIPIFFVYITIWYILFLEISGSKVISVLALIFFVFSDNKLGLNWSSSPMAFFASLSSIHFLQVLSLLLFFKEKYYFSFFILSLTSYIHPGSSITYFLLFSSLLFFKTYYTKNYKLIFAPLIYLIIFTPNLINIIKKSQGAFSLPPNYFQIFDIFQYHAYIGDHINEGYFYTFGLITIIISYLRNKNNQLKYKKELILFFICSLFWCIVWFINLYFIKNINFVHTYLVTRVFYILKPLIIVCFMSFLVDIYNSKKAIIDKLIISLASITLIIFSPLYSSLIILCFLIYLHNKKVGGFFLLLLPSILSLLILKNYDMNLIRQYILKINPSEKAIFYETIIFLSVLIIMFIGKFHNYSAYVLGEEKRFPILILCFFILIFLSSDRTLKVAKRIIIEKKIFDFSWDNYFGIAKESKDYAELLDWVKKGEGNLFIVPPDEYLFLSLRYFTKNGIFIHEGDINQLMYSPNYYAEAFERLKILGLEIEGRHKTNYKKYEAISLNSLKNTNADYIIYNKLKHKIVSKEALEKVYENKTYVVFKIK